MTALRQTSAKFDSDVPATPVYRAPIADPGAWKVADFRTPADYTIELTATHLRDIARALRRIKEVGLGLDDLQREHFDLPSLQPLIDEIRHRIKDGRGFVVLRRLPVEDYAKDDISMIFWGIGTHLGRGLSQSALGDRLGHVKDFSREDPLARAYRNKQELSPHTDLSDVVGLACLRNAKSGGVSRLTSALTLHNVMLDECPEFLERLYRGYVFHRRGEEQPGDLPYTPYRVPVFSNLDRKVSVRYVRSYVEAGEAAAGRPTGEADCAVLDRFEEISKRPELMLEFTLQPGEMYFLNNYTILHARTAFEDYEEEDRRRHLLRLWLAAPWMRPVHPHVHLFAGGGIDAVAGRTPSFDWSSLTGTRN
ncbi:MAG TPA: TauD/TfdA family dioxygenase [Stellaceae bacterium]|nr:TauD/TfdA family dioxygenase [Stellaceae bacterium]